MSKMGDGKDGKRTFDWTGNLSLQTNRNLHRFLTIDTCEEEEQEEVELSLGLSLGGRFGTDKEKLVRSSSISGTFPIKVNKDDEEEEEEAEEHPLSARCSNHHRGTTLVRTASLPVQTDEDWRKRKEVQTLRRMAAKRRRSEKQRGVTPASAFPRWVPPRHQPSVAKQFSEGGGGGSSSGGSESAQGSSSCGGASPASDVVGSSSNTKGKENVSTSKRENPPNGHEKDGKERGLNSIEDMPCVFSQGDGPNGRRIEGILYRYGKGEEVSIMCVCHGRFLSPAEFVEHAGVMDVAHPLKHIVVNPSSNSYL